MRLCPSTLHAGRHLLPHQEVRLGCVQVRDDVEPDLRKLGVSAVVRNHFYHHSLVGLAPLALVEEPGFQSGQPRARVWRRHFWDQRPALHQRSESFPSSSDSSEQSQQAAAAEENNFAVT